MKQPKYIYLHGFASGPGSRKACYFQQKLEAAGRTLLVPDLAEGDFEGLTISRQLAVVERLVARERVRFIGSSLGGYLAALFASRHPEAERLVLLAPAFYFPQRWREALGPAALSSWELTGKLMVYHYGEGREMALGYQIVEDTGRYPGAPEFMQPALVFHGTEDRVVPAGDAKRFAALHPNVRLELLPSGHELTDVLDVIWSHSSEFLLAP